MKRTLAIAIGFLIIGSSTVYIKYFAKGKDTEEQLHGRDDALARPDPIADCRLLAPENPYQDADEPSANRAYDACRAAAELAPGDVETVYRLGTSAFQSDRFDEAMENFHKAELLGSCQALSFLGDDAWYRQKDAKSAEDYYKRGAACKDERAASELFVPENFRASARPEFIAGLYDSDMDKLLKRRFITASYVLGFYEAMNDQYIGVDMDPCWKATHYRGGEILLRLQAAEKGDASNVLESAAYEVLLPKAYQVFIPGLGSRALDDFRESERKAGAADMLRMVESSKCKALLPHKIVVGIETFAMSSRSLLEVVRQEAPEIHSVSELSAWLRQQSQGQSVSASPAR